MRGKFFGVLVILMVLFEFQSYASDARATTQLRETLYKGDFDCDIIEAMIKDNADLGFKRPNHAEDYPISVVGILSVSAARKVMEAKTPEDKKKIEAEAIQVLELMFHHKVMFKDKAKFDEIRDAKTILMPIRAGLSDYIEAMFENGYKVDNKINDMGLMELAEKYDQQEVVKLLETRGLSKISEKDIIQLRFIGAAEEGNIEKLKEYLSKGGVINEKDAMGKTALGAALSPKNLEKDKPEKSYEIVKYLLENGADPNIHTAIEGNDDRDNIAMNLVVFWNKILSQAKKKELGDKFAKLFIGAKGLDVNNRDYLGRTAMHVACVCDNVDVMEDIMQLRPDLYVPDNNMSIAYDYARSQAMVDFFKQIKYIDRDFYGNEIPSDAKALARLKYVEIDAIDGKSVYNFFTGMIPSGKIEPGMRALTLNVAGMFGKKSLGKPVVSKFFLPGHIYLIEAKVTRNLNGLESWRPEITDVTRDETYAKLYKNDKNTDNEGIKQKGEKSSKDRHRGRS